MPGSGRKSVTLSLETATMLEKLAGLEFRSAPQEVDWLVTRRLVEIQETSRDSSLIRDVQAIIVEGQRKGDLDVVPETRVETAEEKATRERNEKIAGDMLERFEEEGPR